MKNVLVIGGGSWGSCLAKLLVENGSNVYLWEHNEKNREIMKTERKNPIFSFEFKLIIVKFFLMKKNMAELMSFY